jgi:flagellar assembly protein FliH
VSAAALTQRAAQSPPPEPTRPEWLVDAPEAPARGRVVRADDALVRIVELPNVDELAERDQDDDDELGAEASGGAAVTWAIGYRNGLAAGHAEGHAEGLAAGRREGLERATAEAVARYDRVLTQAERDAASHLEQLHHLHETVAAQATELAFSIARAVIGRELQLAEDPGADAVRRALAALPGRAEATARLHPDDLARLGRRAEQLSAGTALQLTADPAVAPGGCVLTSGASTVDAGIDAALARVRAALDLPADPAGPPEGARA